MKRAILNLLGLALLTSIFALISRFAGHPFWDVEPSYIVVEWLLFEIAAILLFGSMIFLFTRGNIFSGWRGITFVAFSFLVLLGLGYFVGWYLESLDIYKDF